MRIALDLLIEMFDRNTVKLGQIRIENHFLITQNQDLCADSFGKNNGCCIHDGSPLLRVAICDLKETNSDHSKPEATRIT